MIDDTEIIIVADARSLSDVSHDMANIADTAVNSRAAAIFASPESVAGFWAWLEKNHIKIIAGFDIVDKFSEFVANINAAFKAGASGAVIRRRVFGLADFVNDIASIRDDLFFNRDLILEFDLAEINASDWPDVFSAISNLRANGVAFYIDEKFKSDWAGKIYGFINEIGDDFKADVYLAAPDNAAAEQAYRLFQKIRPEISPCLRFLIKN